MATSGKHDHKNAAVIDWPSIPERRERPCHDFGTAAEIDIAPHMSYEKPQPIGAAGA